MSLTAAAAALGSAPDVPGSRSFQTAHDEDAVKESVHGQLFQGRGGDGREDAVGGGRTADLGGGGVVDAAAGVHFQDIYLAGDEGAAGDVAVPGTTAAQVVTMPVPSLRCFALL